MIKFSSFILLMMIGCWTYSQQPISVLKRHEIFGKAQGTTYTISYYSSLPIIKKSAIDSVFKEIDESMSLYIRNSRISEFNNYSTNQMKLDPHMYEVIKKAFYVYRDSKGLFDVTVKPLVELWGFGAEKEQEMPDSNKVKEVLNSVGMDKLSLKGKLLKKKQAGVQVDLNGIAQGYTVDVLYNYILKKNIKNFIVEVGGEVKTHGKKPNNESFKILIQRPESETENSNHIVELKNKAITTSGSYQNFREVNGYKFSHHIDPRSGYPLTSTIISVTVIADKAIDADAYDNVFMAMTPEDALTFANSKNIMDIYLLYLDNGQVKEAHSTGFAKFLQTK